MSQQSNLRESVLKRLKELGSQVDQELKSLISEGLLTESDYIKLRSEAHEYGEAVLNALEKNDYPPQFQEKLVDQLIKQLEKDIGGILSRAQARKYSNDRLIKRFNTIEYEVASEFGLVYNKIEEIMANKRIEYLKEIKSILKQNQNLEDQIQAIYSRYLKDTELAAKTLIKNLKSTAFVESEDNKSTVKTPDLDPLNKSKKKSTPKNPLVEWASKFFRSNKE